MEDTTREFEADPVQEQAFAEDEVAEELPEEDEDECRVCRGPAEEGRPLFTPCKCSGSMGMTHQDCLTSWLEVTRGSGRCEICKVKFRFNPQYAENTPDRLPAHEVIVGLSSRFMAKWLPLACRMLFAASLWLIAAPLLTNILYHGWMIRPSSILTRWKWELLFPDVVSGAVIVAIIIVSFLSLMSFADFLRVHWQQGPRDQQVHQRQDGARERANEGGAGGNTANETATDMQDNSVDMGLVEFLEARQQAKMSMTFNMDLGGEKYADLSGRIDDQAEISSSSSDLPTSMGAAAAGHLYRHDDTLKDDVPITSFGNVSSGEIGPESGAPETAEADLVDSEQDAFEDLLDEFENESIGTEPAENDQNLHAEENRVVDGVGMEPGDFNDDDVPVFDQVDPGLPDDQVDMEINVALDEMLGLRGPVGALIRNLLWLLAFNATYLGIFGFVPKTIGSVVYSGLFNTTLCSDIVKSVPFFYSENKNETTVINMISRLEQESIHRNTTFKLSDLSVVILGYLSIAVFLVMARYALVVFQKMGQKFGRNSFRRTANQEVRRLHRANAGHAANDLDEQDMVGGEAVASTLAGGLDTMVSIIKVGVLLFLKMFLLPLFLGVCLDGSTIHLFGHDLDQRLVFAGSDLFSFILLHWVAGITFMLLVTVFLLQLREVVHPDVLARVIRPQEPQPDLLGNLLHETVTTHMKRMLLSLVIYAPLLSLQISLPIKLFLETGLGDKFPFYQLNFYHVLMPQLQIPLELITFHLSMLALLERYKNSIGGLQHRWLKFICRHTGLTEFLLPKEVEGFELIGAKPVLVSNGTRDSTEVDPFFLKLAKSPVSGAEEMIESTAMAPNPRPCFVVGSTWRNGERVLAVETSHIALPNPLKHSSTDMASTEIVYLPTKIGRYRLRLGEEKGSNGPTVEFFREVAGEIIPRPPEGWDDLGAGGAWAQGRWAWSNERKSVVEEGVAHRTPFRASTKQRIPLGLMLRIVFLLFLSWLAVTITALLLLSAPLAVGRSIFYLLKVPTAYIHDPFAFCVGAALFFPAASVLLQNIWDCDEEFLKRTRRWLTKFRLPPMQKLHVTAEALTLWFLVAPTLLGVSYEITFVKSSKWFMRELNLFAWKSIIISWLLGTVVLTAWSFLLYLRCFSKQFWANIGNVILEPPMDENGNIIRLDRNVEGGDDIMGIGNDTPWQGGRGRAAKFYEIWFKVFRNWEWDAVDRMPLLDEFARPVTRNLASALVGSSLSFYILVYLFEAAFPIQDNAIIFPIIGLVGKGTFRMFSFRLCMVIHVLFQLASSFRGSVNSWFEAAHEAARDDRYLIGEVLLNYEVGVNT
ncbi:ring-variant domain containing protein [Nitzschia inconspicua]|uniref:RING-type E3 ubiquitin transferase n=1 Tax=Nitzschia inconspicua TaxID=303405 RepID=A0A9K3L8Z3_9STRA|nr:ring-variant domain containing protein [Nitzschia inconspicua]